MEPVIREEVGQSNPASSLFNIINSLIKIWVGLDPPWVAPPPLAVPTSVGSIGCRSINVRLVSWLGL